MSERDRCAYTGRAAPLHDALDALAAGIKRRKVSWVPAADIRDFFGSLERGWLERFFEHRIADERVLRLIQKWLRPGVIEDGRWTASEEGSPQGVGPSGRARPPRDGPPPDTHRRAARGREHHTRGVPRRRELPHDTFRD
jgi:hypothetical protein